MRPDRVDRWLAAISRLSPADIELGLDRVARVYQRLKTRPVATRIVTVAGTNGKGTCAHFLERTLRATGRSVGLYTSPHLLRFNERMRVAGQPISDDALVAAFARVEDARLEAALTFFEFTTLAALTWFERCNLDVAILEVGLGGRLDAVNIVDAHVAVVTRLGLDHTDWLGETLPEIAREKAGVFRAGRPAICADPAPPQALRQCALEIAALPYFQGEEFVCVEAQSHFSIVGPRLTLNNLPRPPGVPVAGFVAALNALAFLDALPPRPVIDAALRDWRLPGRLQHLPGTPGVLLDVAHNPQAAAVLAEHLRPLARRGQVHMVIGLLRDKDVEGYVRNLGSSVSHWYAVPLPGPRGQSAVRLAERLAAGGARAPVCCASVAGGLALARARAQPQDSIVISGSFQVVGPALAWLGIYSRSHEPGLIEGIQWSAN